MLSAILGLALAVPAVWIEVFSTINAWWADGLALIAGATGVALLWTAWTGVVPDWVE